MQPNSFSKRIPRDDGPLRWDWLPRPSPRPTRVDGDRERRQKPERLASVRGAEALAGVARADLNDDELAALMDERLLLRLMEDR